MKKLAYLFLAAAAALPTAAFAEDAAPAKEFTVTGSVTGISEYRLRGISQSDGDPALQGGLTISHSSGFYVGAWSSNLAGYGTFGGANLEFDAIGGYTKTLGKTTLDGGLIWYLYPGTSGHQYLEVYGSVSHPLGPVKGKIGGNYAFKDKSIGGADNLWVYGELAYPVPKTPLTLKGHVGYTDGKGSVFSGPDGHYLDYSVGTDVAWRNLTFNISYVGTNIDHDKADVFYAVPGAKPGHEIVDGTVLVSLTAAF